jgi:YVTN family beta-propeller protein
VDTKILFVSFWLGLFLGGCFAISTPYVWVANRNDGTVSKIDSSTGAVLGTFSVGAGAPENVAVDAEGNVWVASPNVGSVSKLGSDGNLLVTVSVGTAAYQIAVDADGNVWVGSFDSSTATYSVTKLDSSGNTLGVFTADYLKPRALAVDASGNVWVTSTHGYGKHVFKLDSSGNVSGPFTIIGGNSKTFYGVAVDASGNIWVTSYGVDKIVKLDSFGSVLGTFDVGNGPYGIAVDPSGNVWVTMYWDDNVYKLDSDGNVVGIFEVGDKPRGIAIDANGNVWVANGGDRTVTRLDSSGNTVGTYSVGDYPVNMGDATGFALQTFVPEFFGIHFDWGELGGGFIAVLIVVAFGCLYSAKKRF